VPEDNDKIKKLSFSVRASELAEMGIDLTAKDTTELAQVGIKKKRFFFAELSLPSLSVTEARPSRLVNMAALELCTTTDFFSVKEEDSAVCSYLRLLCMMVHREEDVQELGAKGSPTRRRWTSSPGSRACPTDCATLAPSMGLILTGSTGGFRSCCTRLFTGTIKPSSPPSPFSM